jgi:hypothetical protein
MQIEFLVNGGISIILSPENDMEIALLKQFCKQKNDITEIRSSIVILNKTHRGGILIGKETIGKFDTDESKKEDLQQLQ